MLAIIISRTEPYYNAAIRIKETGESIHRTCVIRYIEDIISGGDSAIRQLGRHTLYFLTNVDSVPACVNDVSRVTFAAVVNRRFLLSDTRKFSIQDRLHSIGVPVPPSMIVQGNEFIDTVLRDLRLPFYIKSQKQADTVLRIETEEEFRHAMSGRSADDFYFEESVDIERFHLEKIYYIDGNIESSNASLAISKSLKDMLNDISNVLELNVYSADVFFHGSDHVCIDVNPAPALFHSFKARADLINYALGRPSAPNIRQTVTATLSQ